MIFISPTFPVDPPLLQRESKKLVLFFSFLFDIRCTFTYANFNIIADLVAPGIGSLKFVLNS